MAKIPQKKNPGETPNSAEIGRQYCTKLFALEDNLKDLSNEERFCKRLALKKTVLETFADTPKGASASDYLNRYSLPNSNTMLAEKFELS